MQATLTSLILPKWANENNTQIDCLITLSEFGNEVLPFTASSTDVEEFGRDVFTRISNGEFGEIEDFIPVTQTIEQKKSEYISSNTIFSLLDFISFN
jgi:hypothetical protein